MPRKIPEPKYKQDREKLLKSYKKAFKEISSQLKTIRFDIEREHAESLLNQVAFILRELDADTKKWCDTTIRKAFKDGQANTIVSIGEASSIAEAASKASFSMLARDSVEALINDTFSDLLTATKNTDIKIKRLVRSTVSETMRLRAVEQLGRKTQRDDIIGKLTRSGLSKNLDSEGWVGITDAAGRRWNLTTYAEMVVRTKLQQAHVEGTRVEALERNVDLAVVSSHGATDPCRYFEGMVISLNGTTPGYPTYAELRASGKIFHPNCQHSVHPVRDISLLPKDVRDKHSRKLAEMGSVLGKKFEGPKPKAATPKAPIPKKPTPKQAATPTIWAAQKTIADAQDYAKKLYPNIEWDFAGCHIDTINPSMAEFVRLSNKFPEVAKRLIYVGTHTSKTTPYPYKWPSAERAHAATSGRWIGLTPLYYSDPSFLKYSMERSELKGWHPKGCNKLETTMTHEFGHQVWNWLRREYDTKSLTPFVRSSGFGLGDTLLMDFQRQNRATIQLSEYSTKNAAESWAEGFTAIEGKSPSASLPFVESQRKLLEYTSAAKWYNEGEWKWYVRKQMTQEEIAEADLLYMKLEKDFKGMNIKSEL